MKLFTIENYSHSDKDIVISGPDGLIITVDYDDVDHDAVDKDVKKLVDILNDTWDESVS